jgi:hypothetical protein
VRGAGLFLQGFDSGRELLKWIAIITMTVDHVGVMLYPEFEVLRFIGRLSFPLFAYLLMLGMETTRNIFFTLSAGLLFIYFFKKTSVFAIVPLLASLVLPFDYGVYGIAVIGCMYILKENTKFGVFSLVLLNALFLVPWNTQFFSIAAIPFIVLHKNGSLTTTKETYEEYTIPAWRKYFFYIYYPLHLTLLYIIKLYYF